MSSGWPRSPPYEAATTGPPSARHAAITRSTASGARSGPSASTTIAASTSSPSSSSPLASDAPGPALPAGARHDAGRRLERVCSRDDDDVVDGALLQSLEHLGQQQPLLRRAEARRLTGGEHDRGDAHASSTVTDSMTTGRVGVPFGRWLAEAVDSLDGVHAARHGADDRVIGRQRRGVRPADDEELAARRAGGSAPLRHRDDALGVRRVGGGGSTVWYPGRRSRPASDRRPGSRSLERCDGRSCCRRSRRSRARRATPTWRAPAWSSVTVNEPQFVLNDELVGLLGVEPLLRRGGAAVLARPPAPSTSLQPSAPRRGRRSASVARSSPWSWPPSSSEEPPHPAASRAPGREEG